ncbi:hypothetical protein BCM14_2622 [Jezberella montanilacus]|jgi:hypothetical protein|uniref:Uncharacterized protein n=1 Tax=Jezberella montanilacus TaxID=323426 RepID=A0A2T0XD41_9BURK|nr:DUF5993 family protein [Jezberella montanilacus]PRY96865.1 hypothetical protein BCM14_2622 [Jezberella montanilacus]
MYMFLPFLLALGTSLCAMTGKKTPAYTLWLVLLVVTLLWFKHHATDALTLSF